MKERFPVKDEVAERERVEAYWAWLDANPPKAEVHVLEEVLMARDGFYWYHLKNAADADFEAFHMRHSIGHSWDKYSGFGTIFSLRNSMGIPVMTALMSNNAFVHVREERNARPSHRNAHMLKEFADRMGWTIREELPHFDDWQLPRDGSVTIPHAEMVYFHRDAATNEKHFSTVILDFPVTHENMENLRRSLDAGHMLLPSRLGLPVVEGDEHRVHEIRSFRPSDQPVTHPGVGLNDVLTNPLSSPKI